MAITFLQESDDEIMYDLKQMISKSAISTMNPELSRHSAAQQRITKEMKVCFFSLIPSPLSSGSAPFPHLSRAGSVLNSQRKRDDNER